MPKSDARPRGKIVSGTAPDIVNASITWRDPDNKYKVSLYGKNLTDEEYRVGGYNFAKTPVGDFYNDSVIGYYGPPRTVTASLQYKF